MPRNSWTSLLGDESPEADFTDSLLEGEEKEGALSLPPELVALKQERTALGARMAALTGRSGQSSDEPSRFPVTPLGERRRADEAWARQRDQDALHSSGSTWRQAMDLARPGLAGENDQAGENEPVPALRTGQRLIFGLALRDRLQAPLRRAGLSSDESEDEPRLPERWQVTRDVLSTRVERYYTERRDRLLSVVTGGSGDLDARAEQARDRALEARRLERQRQQADDARVMRARQRPHDLPGESP